MGAIMMTTHTPGPWEVTSGQAPLAWYVIHREQRGKRHTSFMVCAVGEDPVAETNARLIALAPEMAELVRYLAQDSCVYSPYAFPVVCPNDTAKDQMCGPCAARALLARLTP